MNGNSQTIASRGDDWRKSLTDIQAGPLKFCPSFPQVAQRWNDWWKFNADRPLIICAPPKTPDIRWDKALDLLDQPANWLRLRRQQLEQTHYVGETLPAIRVDIGPVAMAAFMGAPLHLAPLEQTTWQTPIIDSWQDAMPLALEPQNAWLKKVLLLLETIAQDARGEYLACLPDLTGAIDALANIRTTQKLCFDLYEQPETLLLAASQAVDAWETVFVRMYDLLLANGVGVTQFIPCWADSPFTVPTCDFNALIGPRDFQATCLPSLKDQARRAGLCVLHLDGPAAARHADALARDPDITAIQYTPGAATPSALAVLPMLQMIQRHKVPIVICASIDEVKPLARQLDPRGLAILVSQETTCQQADHLIDWRDKQFA